VPVNKLATRYLPLGLSLVSAVYACSGTPDVVNGGLDDGQGGEGAASTGGSGGSSSGGKGGGPIVGGKGGSAGKGGKGGASGRGGGTGDAGAENAGTGGTIVDAGLPDVTFTYDASVGGEGGGCAAVQGEATLVKRPMDIIVSIDNSGSMEGEIEAVVDRINGDFAAIIEASEIDYRVIMVSRYGAIDFSDDLTNFGVCIGPPLGNAACPSEPSPALVNTARFFHHSTDIGSRDMWCKLLNSYTETDEIPQNEERNGWNAVAPNGWQEWLRTDSFKVFIGITDDAPGLNSGGTNQNCRTTAGGVNDPGGLADTLAGAQTFDRAIRELAPAHFGAYDAGDPAANRNYAWYSIVGMSEKPDPDATVPYEPSEDVVTTICTNGGGNDDGVRAGIGYQELSRLTGGLRYSNCLNDDFDAIFNAIAEGVIEGARASCEYDVPVPTGGIIDPDQTQVSYLPGAGAAVSLPRASSEATCDAGGGFYFNAGLDKIFLCPATCTVVQDDLDARVSIDFGCLGS
jgi:hypothetical protein